MALKSPTNNKLMQKTLIITFIALFMQGCDAATTETQTVTTSASVVTNGNNESGTGTTPTRSDTLGSDVYAILGGTFGGIFLFLCVLLAIFLYVWCKKHGGFLEGSYDGEGWSQSKSQREHHHQPYHSNGAPYRGPEGHLVYPGPAYPYQPPYPGREWSRPPHADSEAHRSNVMVGEDKYNMYPQEVAGVPQGDLNHEHVHYPFGLHL